MKYFIVIGVLTLLLFIFLKQNNIGSKSETVKSNKEEGNQETVYSGTISEIKEGDYNRFVFANQTTAIYLRKMINEYTELYSDQELGLQSFWIGQTDDWHIIKVDDAVSFYSYHNLVGWLNGYDRSPDIPKHSIGYSQNKFDKEQDYVFYLDLKNDWGDTGIGAFKNGNSFFIYFPDSFEPNGNLTISNDINVQYKEIMELIPLKKLEGITFESI